MAGCDEPLRGLSRRLQTPFLSRVRLQRPHGTPGAARPWSGCARSRRQYLNDFRSGKPSAAQPAGLAQSPVRNVSWATVRGPFRLPKRMGAAAGISFGTSVGAYPERRDSGVGALDQAAQRLTGLIKGRHYSRRSSLRKVVRLVAAQGEGLDTATDASESLPESSVIDSRPRVCTGCSPPGRSPWCGRWPIGPWT